jgi:hypothetical protein
MRTFEILLIAVNIFSLTLVFRKQVKAVWLGNAGLNVLLLVMHFVFEVVRYQMMFAYVFAIMFPAFALMKAFGDTAETGIPKVLKYGTVGVAFLMVVSTIILVYDLPVLGLPELTGKYMVLE